MSAIVAVHPETRIVYLGSTINAESAAEIVQALIDLSNGDKKPITLIINSEGGYADEAFAIYDAIKLCSAPVDALVLRTCYSSAVLVLQACRKRFLSPNTKVMIHDGTIAISRIHAQEAQTEAKEHARSHKDFSKLLSERTGMPLKKLRRLSAYGKYFTAEEAVKHGFADRVVSEGSGFNGGK